MPYIKTIKKTNYTASKECTLERTPCQDNKRCMIGSTGQNRAMATENKKIIVASTFHVLVLKFHFMIIWNIKDSLKFTVLKLYQHENTRYKKLLTFFHMSKTKLEVDRTNAIERQVITSSLRWAQRFWLNLQVLQTLRASLSVWVFVRPKKPSYFQITWKSR